MDMSWLERVQGLWEAYAAKTEQLERDRKPGSGIFGLTPGPRDDPSHEQFAADAQALLGDMLAAAPGPEETREVLAYIYHAQEEHQWPLTAYWMFRAMHGMTTELAALLAPADARALAAEYKKMYRRGDRLPAQKKVLAALERAGK